ncbi:DUF7017 domain-containing protein [Endozoicomonas acroporae]|uniref:DUF7017 domain-containing protein n=1 Tax=Endozoicomonas acroporae TaxID=1701104 RepID=UPI003D799F86
MMQAAVSEPVWQQVNRLRKAGDLPGAWNTGFAGLAENPQNRYLRGALFWVCYDYLKGFLQPIMLRGQQNSGYRPSDREYRDIEGILEVIGQLQIPTGGFEYSRLLVLFRKNMDCFPTLIRLVMQHQDDLFNDEDKMPYVSDRGELPSLMLNCVRKVALAWQSFGKHWQLPLSDVLALLDRARGECRDIQHKLWLDYDQARCLVMAGKNREAREFILPVLRRKQSESWAWGALASTYRQDDSEAAVILFAKGIGCAVNDQFSIPLLKGIAPLLMTQGKSREGSLFIKKLVHIYQSQEWAVKQNIIELTQNSGYDQSVDLAELPSVITQLSAKALTYLHGPTRQCVGVVERCHQSGKGFEVYLSQRETLSVRLGLHQQASGQRKLPSPGDYVTLTLAEPEPGCFEVVASGNSEPVDMDGVETLTGILRVNPKGFGFVEDTFVPPFLLPKGMDGQRVTVIRIKSVDRKKQTIGWKAIHLGPDEGISAGIG